MFTEETAPEAGPLLTQVSSTQGPRTPTWLPAPHSAHCPQACGAGAWSQNLPGPWDQGAPRLQLAPRWQLQMGTVGPHADVQPWGS